MRSNFTPIWYASVQPALSYGGIGGPPGYWKSFGMILRLEHVEHVRAERLRRLHDVASRPDTLAADA